MLIIGTRLTKNKKNKKYKKNKKNKKKNKKNKKKNQKKIKFLKYIKNKSEGINYVWFNYYFDFTQPSDLAKKLLEIKDKKMYIYFVEEIKNRWSNLKGKTEKTPGDEKENEREKKY